MERQHSRLSFTARPHTGVVACCDMHLRHHWDVVAFGNDYFDVADEAVMNEFWAAVAQLYMHGTPCMFMEITAKHHW